MINEQGGVNGRKINLHQPRRRLQPAEDGRADPPPGRAGARSPSCSARSAPPPTSRSGNICNDNKVPQLFVATGAANVQRSQALSLDYGLASPATRPRRTSTRSTSSQPKPDAKIAVLYQNDDFGKDYLIGLKDGLGPRSRQDDRQGGHIRGRGADGLLCKSLLFKGPAPTCSSLPRRRNSPRRQSASPTTSVGIRKRYVTNVSTFRWPLFSSRRAPRSPRALITAIYLKDPTDARWRDDPGLQGICRVHSQIHVPPPP